MTILPENQTFPEHAGEFTDEQFISINGLEQRILVTTRDRTAPVLLFIHGHGTPTSLFAHDILADKQSTLCDRFVLVHWDQRGAGASYSRKIPEETMNQSTMVSDAYQVVQYLKERFEKEKIYILAQSWGSIIGLRLLQNHSEHIAGYIGEGQTANYPNALQEMYSYSLKKAAEKEDKKALRQLEKYHPPDSSSTVKYMMKFNGVANKWANRYILKEYDGRDLMQMFKRSLKTSPYFRSPASKIKLMKGMQFTQRTTLKELYSTDLRKEIQRLEVPVRFIMGRYDFITPGTKIFFEQLEAGSKELLIYENSGHAPSLDEPERFERDLIRFFGKENNKFLL